MSGFRMLIARLLGLFGKSSSEKELNEELRSHLEMLTEENVRKGMPPEEARYAALRSFGAVEPMKQVYREQRGLPLLESFVQDVRHALRQVRREPKFAATAILTLALGIGATTAMFSIVDAVLLHRLPYRNPAQLIEIGSTSQRVEDAGISAGDYTDLQAQILPVAGMAACNRMQVGFQVLTGAGDPDLVWVSAVSSNMFQLLGVNAAFGRTFTTDDIDTAILSHQYWQTHFARNLRIIGKTLALDNKWYTVIGIAPADFEFPDPNVQVWVPLRLSAAEKIDREHRRLVLIARLNPGTGSKQAQTVMDLVSRRFAAQYPKTDAGWTMRVKEFKYNQIGASLRSAILALFGAVVFVLMITWVNVAGMLLARGIARQAEMAIRAALGGGRLRLMRQLIVESLLLAGAGCVLGLVLGYGGLAILVTLLPRFGWIETQALHHISINLPVLGFTVAVSVVTGIGVGLFPALRCSSVNLNDALKQQGRSSGKGPQASVLQGALVVCEVALALVLLVGAGLMIESFRHLSTASTGFNPDHVLTARVPLVKYKHSEGAQSAAFYKTVLERIRAIPGVRSAGMVNNLPFSDLETAVDFPAPPGSAVVPGRLNYVSARCVSPGFIAAMGIRLKGGRDFTAEDNQKDAPCVRIVNETLARLYWPGENAVGKQIPNGCRKNAPASIVGVVADSKQHSVDSHVEAEEYIPYAQLPFASFATTFVVRTSSNPADVAGAVRRAVSEIDHDQPVIQIRTLESVVSESIWRQHLSASVLGAFAVIALVLSAVGIYGVFSYSVSQRTHEIGIRSALGATRADILRMVITKGLLLSAVGVGSGVVASLMLTRLLNSLLFGVSPRDPLTFAGLSLLLMLVAFFSLCIPARRATKVDPMVALRHE